MPSDDLEQEPPMDELQDIQTKRHTHNCTECGVMFDCFDEEPCSNTHCEICDIGS